MKTLKYLLLFVPLLFTSHPSEGQQRITLSGGITHLAQQDVVHTPFVHGGASPISFGASYRRSGTRWLHEAEGRYSAVASKFGESFDIDHGDHSHDNPPHGFLFFEAAYRMGRVLESGRQHHAAAGASARFDLQAGFYRYGADENFGYFISPSLNVWYARSYRISPRNALRGHVEVPLLSWVARSPYMVNDDDFIENISSNNRLKTIIAFIGNGSFATWDRLQRFNAVLEYEHALSRKFSMGTAYRFAFTRSIEPRSLISYQSSLNLTTSFNL